SSYRGIGTGWSTQRYRCPLYASFPYVGLPQGHEPVLLYVGFCLGKRAKLPEQVIAEDVPTLGVAVREPYPVVLDSNDHRELGAVAAGRGIVPGNNVQRF